MKVTKKDFVKKYRDNFNGKSEGSIINLETSSFIIEVMADTLKEIIADDMEVGDTFSYRGLGTFKKGRRRVKTNNLNGYEAINGEYDSVSFLPCQALKDMVREHCMREN